MNEKIKKGRGQEKKKKLELFVPHTIKIIRKHNEIQVKKSGKKKKRLHATPFLTRRRCSFSLIDCVRSDVHTHTHTHTHTPRNGITMSTAKKKKNAFVLVFFFSRFAVNVNTENLLANLPPKK